MEEEARIEVRVRPFIVKHDVIKGHSETLYAIELVCPEMSAGPTIVAIHNPRFTPLPEIQAQAMATAQRAKLFIEMIEKNVGGCIDKSKLN